MRISWQVALVWLLSAGCFYPADRGRMLETRVDKLTDENASLEKELKDQREKLFQKMDAKIAEVQKALDSLDRAARRSDADIGVQMQKATEDVAQLRGQVETYLYKINDLEAQLKKVSDDLGPRVATLESSESAKAAEAKKRAEEIKRPTDKKEFLKLAEDRAKAGDVPLARELYAEFLKKWAKDEMAADAYFGLGETYYNEEKCREALSEYRQVIEKFPSAHAAPQSYLHVSDCFLKLKMGKESTDALQELVRSYPKSEAAKIARARLEPAKKAPKKGSK